MLKQTNWIVGTWKFGDKFSVADLGEIAQKWMAEDPYYLQLLVRKVAKNQMGIGFTYKLPDDKDAHAGYNEYFDRTSDRLKKQFGNDFVGWDIAAPVWLVQPESGNN